MSDIKVNGNIYNGVTSIKMMKADDSGYAEYKEGVEEATDTLMDVMLSNGNVGNIESDSGNPLLSWMHGLKFGTVSFPYATKASGPINSAHFDNLLLPNVTDFPNHGGNGSFSYRMASGIQNCNIPGVLDLSSLATSLNNTMNFAGSAIGTLKLGSYVPKSWNSTTITNFVWYGMPESAMSDAAFTMYFSATVTNMYVPAGLVDAVQAQIDEGKWKITNLYSIDEWED